MQTSEIVMQNCYYFLYTKTIGRSAIRQKDQKNIAFSIEHCSYIIGVSEDEKRTLVCFDGNLLSGGLPQGSKIVKNFGLKDLFYDSKRVYKKIEICEPYPTYSRGTKMKSFTFQSHNRFFVLMEEGSKGIFVRYDKTLKPCYVVITIKNNSAEFEEI